MMYSNTVSQIDWRSRFVY